ncbi:Hypothetical protein SMAX5B_016907 [Scophthalmus maximus]|uniref:Uncharacterized protein n=1 Tax=Scophthalmus maximus TaxID=52904 RepID=A0A2U9CLM3_SCOMX|nr:Hypothetical protein SMAX5B_016907 [Scophthalmus maximus]
MADPEPGAGNCWSAFQQLPAQDPDEDQVTAGPLTEDEVRGLLDRRQDRETFQQLGPPLHLCSLAN